MAAEALDSDLERRKQVRLQLRPDLDIAPHKYEGRTYYIVKDPASLRYYRFKEQEHFILGLLDGTHTLEEAQKEFEKKFRPERLPLEDLEGFAQQLLTVGLAANDSLQAGKQLFERRKKRLRREWLGILTNILYIKIPVFDPDRLLTRMLPYLSWIFTPWNALFSLGLMLSALLLVATHFEAFRDKLPGFEEFFSFKTVAYLWLALGMVKVIHEFGHGLSCKVFGGEVHEMGALFLCLSPCLYCNVSDAWTMPSKWQRIIISFAGIYVELIIAALATFVWWNSPSQPFIYNLSLSLMVVCSVSTVVFNGNPLMRFDGYYVLADWLEIPNLRDRCNRYLKNLALEYCLGVEVQKEQYMALRRKLLFVSYTVVSWLYRWIITFSILYFLAQLLKPYKLGALSGMLALGALGSMIGWPLYRLIDNLRKRGRFPDMKPKRVRISAAVAAALLLAFFFLPLPVSRVREVALVQVQPQALEKVFVPHEGSVLEKLEVRNGQAVYDGEVLARFSNRELEGQLDEAIGQADAFRAQRKALQDQQQRVNNEAERGKLDVEIARAEAQFRKFDEQIIPLQTMVRKLEIRAPRSGAVMGLPLPDEVGRAWETEQERPLCSIGDPQKLRVLVPVSPADYRLLKDDLQSLKRKNHGDLPVTIRVRGRAGSTWEGAVSQLPETEAKEVPAALTTKFGGPLAFKPGTNSNIYQPLTQQYLIGVDLLNPDAGVCPGTLAQVKIHCRWKTAAWWTWRTISSAFDLGLL